ncbi:MAG: hypothetical protein ACYTEQ_21600 [Planctomycetota bacterium]
MAEIIHFSSRRKVDKALIQKLNAIAPYYYDDPTGVARKLLHERVDQVIEQLGIDVYSLQTQPMVG